VTWIEMLAIAGMLLGLISKWLLGNRNAAGWALAVASALCWTAYSIESDTWVLVLNNALSMMLVLRGCYKWKS
jgi:threonine/homoserine efflux transporter RhtA